MPLHYRADGTLNLDLDQASVLELTELASAAFRLGLEDGFDGGRLRSSGRLIEDLGNPDRRRLHRRKLRQVYGAGFDLGRLRRAVAGGLA